MSLPTSKYFNPASDPWLYKCRDGTPYPEEWTIRFAVKLQALDTIREAYGHPLVIVSGYRSKAHNDFVGGAAASQHMLGRADDIRPYFPPVDGVRRPLKASDIHDLHRCVENLLAEGKLPAVGGVGLYPQVRQGDAVVPGWLHCDTRPRPADGHIARWTGAAFGDEQTSR